MELARLEAQKKASWLSRFKKDKSGNNTRRGSTASTASASSAGKGTAKGAEAGTAAKGSGAATTASASAGSASEVDDDDDLPPRLDSKPANESVSKLDVVPTASDTAASVEKAIASPASGAGFDIAKIRAEIAEDDGSGQLLSSSGRPVSGTGTAATAMAVSRSSLESPALAARDIIRTPSAPPARPLMGEMGRSDSAPGPKTPTQRTREQAALIEEEEAYERDLQRRLKEEALEMARVTALEEQAERERQKGMRQSRDAAAARRTGSSQSSSPSPSPGSGHGQRQASPSAFPGYMQNNPFAMDSTASLAETNPFGGDAPFSFAAAPSHSNASVLSFGGEDGNISFAPLSTELPSGSSPWAAAVDDDKRASAAWRDPWSSNTASGGGNDWSNGAGAGSRW